MDIVELEYTVWSSGESPNGSGVDGERPRDWGGVRLAVVGGVRIGGSYSQATSG